MRPIIAGSIVRNAEKTLPSMLASMNWVSKHYICNDHSTDSTAEILGGVRSQGVVSLIEPWFERSMLYYQQGVRNVSRELSIRNQFIQKIFTQHPEAVLVLVDADELFSQTLLPYIKKIAEGSADYDSIAISCCHLYEKNKVLEIYPQIWNNVAMIDPHVRVVTADYRYESGEWADSPDPFIRHTTKTLCLDENFHIHLKYLKALGNQNDAIRVLPKNLNDANVSSVLRPLNHGVPGDLVPIINDLIN